VLAHVSSNFVGSHQIDDLAIDSHAETQICCQSKLALPPHSVLLDVSTGLTTPESCSKALSLLEEASKEVQTFPFTNDTHSHKPIHLRIFGA